MGGDMSIRGQAIAYAKKHNLKMRYGMAPELEDTAPLLDAVEAHKANASHTWTYSQVNPGGADVSHGHTFTGTNAEWAEHLASRIQQGIEVYDAKARSTDFPATPEGFAAARAKVDRMAAKPAVVVITDDAEVTVHATDDVDVFVYPCEETAEDLRRGADMLDERGLIEAARDVRRLAAGEP